MILLSQADVYQGTFVYDSKVLAVVQRLANRGSPLALPMRGKKTQLCHAEHSEASLCHSS